MAVAASVAGAVSISAASLLHPAKIIGKARAIKTSFRF
jgi:hypothetical protein